MPLRSMTINNKNEESAMKAAVRRFLEVEEGLTVVGYAIAAGLVGAAVVVALTNLGAGIIAIIAALIAAMA